MHIAFRIRLVLPAVVLAIGAGSGFAATVGEKIAARYEVLGTDGWSGGVRTRFRFEGYEAWIVEPPPGVKAAEGRPWTWTMQWATAFVQRTPVVQLLRKGWHHATIITFQHRMDETGLALSHRFHRFLVDGLGLAPRTSLIGMSWGGFFSARYINAYPGEVSAVYYDCPLLTFTGFCDGKGDGPWKGRMPADGWEDSPEMPVNMVLSLVKQDIPILLLYGGEDRVVVPALNAETLVARYRALGGSRMQVVKRAQYAHHPHGVELNDPLIANFFLAAHNRDLEMGKPTRVAAGLKVKGVAN